MVQQLSLCVLLIFCHYGHSWDDSNINGGSYQAANLFGTEPNFEKKLHNSPDDLDLGLDGRYPIHNPFNKEHRYKKPHYKEPPRYKEPIRYKEPQRYREPHRYNEKKPHNAPEPLYESTKKDYKSLVRQNYDYETEDYVNKRINLELRASYEYSSMVAYFERSDVALFGFAKRFKKASNDADEYAKKLIHYQNLRGGRVKFGDIKKPSRSNWGSALEAVKASLFLEKKVNSSLLKLRKLANEKGDSQLENFIEGEYRAGQVESIKEIGDLITRLKRAGPNIGLTIIDNELLKIEANK